MADRVYSARKTEYFARVSRLLSAAQSILIVGADNVRSTQMHQIRRSLRNKGTLLMGKNTVLRKVIRSLTATKPELESLLPTIKENIGLILVDEGSSLKEVADICLSNKLAAPAKAGAISPCKVVVPAGPTGMEPTQTAFLQALNIATKIQKGQIEIINDVVLLEEGDKVGSSEAALLQRLNMMPFQYGLAVKKCWEGGFTFDAAILDISDDDVVERFGEGLTRLAAISLAIGYPTLVAIPHMIINAYKKLLAIVLETDYVFEQAKEIKERYENPEAFAAAAPVAAAAEVQEAAPVEEEEEESDDFGGGGLFGDDDDY